MRRALALRARLACLLADSSSVRGRSCAEPEWGAEDWKLVLAADCCAIAAHGALRKAGLLESLRPAVRDVIRAARAEETQRVAMARAVLADLSAIAVACGAPMLLLKGGAYLASSADAALDLGDVDVALEEHHAPAVWRALWRAGWRRKHPDGDSAVSTVPLALGDQWPALVHPLRGSLYVEIHRRVTYGSSLELIAHARRLTIDDYPGLTRATGAATFEGYLRHCVLSHPLRRGHLRDVILLASVWEECTLEERRTATTALRNDDAALELEALLSAIQAFAAGENREDHATLKRAVSRKYLLLCGEERTFTQLIPGWWTRSYAALEEQGKRRRYIPHTARTGPSPFEAASIWRLTGGFPRALALTVGSRTLRATYRLVVAALLVTRGCWMRWRVASVM